MNELDLIRTARPLDDYPDDQRASTRARLMAEMFEPPAPQHVRRRHHRISWCLQAGLAFGLAIGIATAVTVTSLSGAPAAHPTTSRTQSVQLLSATVVLRKAAAAAERRPAVLPGPHQWVYVKWVKTGLADPRPTQSWTRFDGEQSADIEHGRLVILPYGSAQDGVSDATPQGAASYLRSVPASPAALLAVIYRKAEAEPRDQWAVPGNRDTEAFSILMTLMYNAPAGVPPAVQANVFRATALIPGVHVSRATDALGRPALALSGAGLNGYFLLDPKTYALIGLRDGKAAITRITVAVVDRPGQR
jgi:hypothetical protein